MVRLSFKATAAAACLLLAVFGAAARAGRGPSDASVCPTPPGISEATCTVLQLRHGAGEPFDGNPWTQSGGVITKWWVASGPASAATSAVQVRLRLFDGFRGLPGRQTRYRRLPIEEPGAHKFFARLPIHPGQQVGLDVSVLGSSRGGAAAPIARSVTGGREIGEWVPPLGLGPRRPTDRLQGARLQLETRVEADFDDDGWGDRSQDDCPYDPRRQSACLPDQVKPHLQISYAPWQDFIARHKVFLRIGTNEYTYVFAGGILGVSRHGYGLYGSEARMKAGDSLIFAVPVDGMALKVAKRAITEGAHPSVRVSVEAADASGNKVRKEFEVRWKRG